MEQADEDKLIEDAIAALDRLLEEVGCLNHGDTEDSFPPPLSAIQQGNDCRAAERAVCVCYVGGGATPGGGGGRVNGGTGVVDGAWDSEAACSGATGQQKQPMLPNQQPQPQPQHHQQQQQQQRHQNPKRWALHSALVNHHLHKQGNDDPPNRSANHHDHLRNLQPHSAPDHDHADSLAGDEGTAGGANGNRLARSGTAATMPYPPPLASRPPSPTSQSPLLLRGSEPQTGPDALSSESTAVGLSKATPTPTRLSRTPALRRRGIAFSITPDQDEALARALEKARRMSDTVNGSGDLVLSLLANRGCGRTSLQEDRLGVDGAEGTGGIVPENGTGAAFERAFSKGHSGSRRHSKNVVLSNTELLNDLVDEALANRPDDYRSGTGIRGPASAAPATRQGETRGGGGGNNGGGNNGGGANVVDKSPTGGGGGRLGPEQGLMLWTGNKSRVERARLAVRLLQATDLSRTKEDKQIDPYAVVSCEGKTYTSKAVMKSKDPFWDEFFVFDVPQPAFAELKVKVYDHLRCWRPVFMGQVHVPVKSIAEFPARYSQPTWHQMRSRAGKLKGQVQMQLFYTAEWVHRALNVLACTWNVGNAEPPQDLNPWLQGVQSLQHDLVAIGVQECLYKVGAGAMDAANQMAEEEYGMGEEGAQPYDTYAGNAFGGLENNEGGTSEHRENSPYNSNGHCANGLYSNYVSNGLANGHIHGFTHRSSNEPDSGQKLSNQGLAVLDNTTSLLESAANRGANGNNGLPTDIPSSSTNAPAAVNHGSRLRLSVLVPSGGGAGGGSSAAVTPRGGTSPSNLAVNFDATDSGTGPGTVTDGVGSTTCSGVATRESSTTMPTGAPSPPPFSTSNQRLPHRVRTAHNLMTLGQQQQVAGAGSADSRSSHNGGGAPQPPLPSRSLLTAAAARRRSGVIESAPNYHPALNRVLSMAAGWPPQTAPAIAAANAPSAADVSFSSARGALQPSAGSAATFGRPSVSNNAAAGSIGGGGPAVRGTTTQGKAAQQTYKSKGVLTDMTKVGGEFRDLWEERLKEAVGPGYFMVASAHMGQIRLLLFARNDVYAAISDVRTAKQATGVAGVATNKGGVGISLRVWETTMAFVNSHLAAHQDRTRARNNNYREIIRGLKLDCQGSNMDVLTAFHHVIWVGDLNYRLDYGQQASNPTESPTQADFAALVTDVQQGAFAKLLEVDQLRREMAAKRVFLGFHEGPINFEPSFKVLRRRGYEYNPQRSPAYCDRILYRSNLPLKQIRVVSYFSPSEIATSDHKPVGAVLVVPTVWRTTVDEYPSGPGGRSQGLSGYLTASESVLSYSQYLPRGIHSHPHQKPHAQVRLIFTLLRAHGLFMLRSRRRSSVSANTEFPSPQLLLSAPCMRDSMVRSRVATQTREPLWADAEHAGLGPLVVELKSASLAEMAHFRLWVRVFDLRGAEKGARLGGGGGGGGGGGSGGNGGNGKGTGGGGYKDGRGKGDGGGGGGGSGTSGNVLARGVLPLVEAVTSLLQDPNGVAPFKTMLELHGLPAGTLEGNMRLEVVERSKTLERTHGSARTALYEISESFGARGSAQSRNSGGASGLGLMAKTSSRRSNTGHGYFAAPEAEGAGGDSVAAGGGGFGSVGTFFASLRRTLTMSAVTPQQVPLQPPQPLYDASGS
ncbi:hypothetical protein VaNZ11_009857 [Volvox africanus]|uniref:C2 domain-containing protein n=1 Tax=Volvox africanus TaxID=51714 RepID=A0ABQ5S9W5_9CHLO|nr:hypothetical protein VaNZ11_009857 [Volvox africanus]